MASEDILSKPFSHIYIEEDARNDDTTKAILAHFPYAVQIPIRHYKDVFTPAGQNIVLQKKIPSLILAKKAGRLVYKGAPVCQDFGNEWFYYTSSIMNCCYDCEYCYLQGMYPSADIVIFTNITDIFTEVDELLKEHPVYLCISYDTDLLGLEGLTGYVKKWIEFVSPRPNLLVECRTKSAGSSILKKYIDEGLKIPENFIMAWTLSPDKISANYEHGTPSLSMRFNALKECTDLGISTRICFDPILLVQDWEKNYERLIDETFSKINPDKIRDVSCGAFRVSKGYLLKMRKRRPLSSVTRFPYMNENGTCSYGSKKDAEIIEYMTKLLLRYIDKDKIFIWK